MKRPILHTSLVWEIPTFEYAVKHHPVVMGHTMSKNFSLSAFCQKLFAFACKHWPNSLHLNSLILNFQVHTFKNRCGSFGLTLLAIFLQLKKSIENGHKHLSIEQGIVRNISLKIMHA